MVNEVLKLACISGLMLSLLEAQAEAEHALKLSTQLVLKRISCQVKVNMHAATYNLKLTERPGALIHENCWESSKGDSIH